jgi:adenosyl cobinamide kinase/adenosyl cobinamide phosphate guanylyltransferase
MSVKITFVIGGARSGKSSFVLNKAAEIEGPRVYIATGEALDDEMKERIKQHREDRGSDWDTYEEPLNVPDVLSNIDKKYNTIVIDCLTLWLSNVMIRTKNKEQRSKTTEKRILELIMTLNQYKESSVCSLKSGLCNLYIVSNEVGMGIVPENPLAREFRDLAGFLNQRIAEVADDVYMVTAGIPVKIK